MFRVGATNLGAHMGTAAITMKSLERWQAAPRDERSHQPLEQRVECGVVKQGLML